MGIQPWMNMASNFCGGTLRCTKRSRAKTYIVVCVMVSGGRQGVAKLVDTANMLGVCALDQHMHAHSAGCAWVLHGAELEHRRDVTLSRGRARRRLSWCTQWTCWALLARCAWRYR